MTSRWCFLALVGSLCFALNSQVSAGVIRVAASDFVAGSGKITFSEFGLGTQNPTYLPGTYGGGADSPIVTFGGWFQGQRLSLTPGIDCPGAAPTACVVGNPVGPLALDANALQTFISGDAANPTSPVLSGAPRFNGPIAVLFNKDQTGVGFDGGFFNAVGSTGITAFARDGSLLGSVTNTGLGVEFLGLVADAKSPQIAGVFLDLIGNEPAGFAIDNLRFGVGNQVNVPEPSTFSLLGVGALVFVVFRRRLGIAG